MKVYTAIWNDRHSEPTAHVFSDGDVAVQWAKDMAMERCTHEEDYEESDIEGWLINITYSCEGDSIWVVESEIDEELEDDS